VTEQIRESVGRDGLDIRLCERVGLDEGFFVEAGANDGLIESNSLRLEQEHRWTGILVEPVPELAARCRVNRPHCIVEEVALVADTYASETTRMTYSGTASLVNDARRHSSEVEAYAEAGARLQDGVVPYEVTVPASTLSAVLDRHGRRHVDLLSLDVEGYEPKVLEGLDLRRDKPTFILIEVLPFNERAIEELLAPYYDREDELGAKLWAPEDPPLPAPYDRLRTGDKFVAEVLYKVRAP
jgi:FkbM family methyltransferase